MRRFAIVLSMLGVALSALAAACGEDEAAIPRVTVEAADFSFDAPAEVKAGLTSIQFENTGKEPHHAQLARLRDGVTLEQLQTAFQQGPETALPLLEFDGGAGTVIPGRSQEVVVNLRQGQYVLLCFVSGADGIPHLAKGMLRPFTVTAGGEQAKEPGADTTVTLKDFEFQLSSEIEGGKHTWRVVNEGPQLHEMGLLKLAAGKTFQDVGAWFQAPQGPPPFQEAGGAQAIDAGKSGWLTADLEAGNYAMVCFVPDPASGKAHVELGMVREFAVK